MRVLITGDRLWQGSGVMTRALLEHVKPGDVVVHGGARGADSLAGQIASGMEGVTVEVFHAKWDLYGRAAGPKRNQEMLNSGIDKVLAFHPDLTRSKGTADMVRRARRAGIPVIIYTGKERV